jgi:hypothetical protein
MWLGRLVGPSEHVPRNFGKLILRRPFETSCFAACLETHHAFALPPAFFHRLSFFWQTQCVQLIASVLSRCIHNRRVNRVRDHPCNWEAQGPRTGNLFNSNSCIPAVARFLVTQYLCSPKKLALLWFCCFWHHEDRSQLSVTPNVLLTY